VESAKFAVEGNLVLLVIYDAYEEVASMGQFVQYQFLQLFVFNYPHFILWK